MFNSNYVIYIATNPKRTTFYIGVTNDLTQRLTQHFENAGNPKTFAGRYFCYNLVYYERFVTPDHAIERDKELKGWSRPKKLLLIKSVNPYLKFLNLEVMDQE